MADAIAHERGAGRHRHRRTVAVCQPADARDIADAVARQIVTGQDADDARRGAGRSGIDRADPRMRVRRAQHDGMSLTQAVDVIKVVAVAGQKAAVFDTPDRLTDAELLHADLPPETPCRTMGG